MAKNTEKSSQNHNEITRTIKQINNSNITIQNENWHFWNRKHGTGCGRTLGRSRTRFFFWDHEIQKRRVAKEIGFGAQGGTNEEAAIF
jgi:hypothetical protein